MCVCVYESVSVCVCVELVLSRSISIFSLIWLNHKVMYISCPINTGENEGILCSRMWSSKNGKV